MKLMSVHLFELTSAMFIPKSLLSYSHPLIFKVPIWCWSLSP